MGKPLPGHGTQDDELWWVKGYLRREGVSTEALLPTSLRPANRPTSTVKRHREQAGQRRALGGPPGLLEAA
jgi:hypothetical protein